MHLGVIKKLTHWTCVCAFQVESEFESVGFKERGKPEYPEKNLSEQGRKPTASPCSPPNNNMEFFLFLLLLFHCINMGSALNKS